MFGGSLVGGGGGGSECVWGVGGGGVGGQGAQTQQQRPGAIFMSCPYHALGDISRDACLPLSHRTGL